MHSGKLNWTQLNWSIQFNSIEFSFELCIGVTRDLLPIAKFLVIICKEDALSVSRRRSPTPRSWSGATADADITKTTAVHTDTSMTSRGRHYVILRHRCPPVAKPLITVPASSTLLSLVSYRMLATVSGDLAHNDRLQNDFLSRDAMHKRGLCRCAVSGGCLSPSCIVSKRLNIRP